MLWTIVVVLVAIWLAGVVIKATIGGLLHLLLIAAIAIFLYRMFRKTT